MPGPAPAPDPAAVLAALGLPAPAAAQPAVGGFDALVWRVEFDGRPYALRVLGPGSEGRCAREVAALAAAGAAGAPVPTVRVQGQWEGRPALLVDWCPGQSLVDAIRARPPEARRLGRLFGSAQAALHALAAPPALNADWLGAGGPEAAAVEARLRALPARTDVLAHFDYHPYNVLTDGTRITGVIDWDHAGAADPRADLARTLSILRLEARRPGLFSPLIVAAILRFDLGWREGYASASGLPVDAAHALFYAWAGLAMVADLQGRRDEAFFRRVRFWSACWAARLPG